MKRVLLAIAVLAVVAVVWLVGSDDAAPPSAPAAAEPPPVESSVEQVPAVETAAPAPVDAKRPAPPDVVRPADAHPGRELLVLEAGTNVPIAGVDVAFTNVTGRPADAEESAPPDDLIGWILRIGTVSRSEADGKVRVPAFHGQSLVAARHLGLEGAAVLEETDEPWRLVLHRPVPLAVIVEEEDGTPCGGVDVELDWPETTWTATVHRRTTGAADGAARFPDVPPLTDSTPATASVTADLPFAAAPAASFDTKPLPAAPVRIVLPPHGRVRCEVVDESGTSAPDGQPVVLRTATSRDEKARRSPFDDAPEWRAAVAGGAAVFPYAGLGLEFVVEVPSRDDSLVTTKKRFAGPASAGEETLVRVTLGEHRPTIVGRLVDAQGEPAVGIALVARLAETGSEASRDSESCTTDASGGFRLAFDRPAGAASSPKLHLSRTIRFGRGGWTDRKVATVGLPAVLPAGPIDIGTVLYQRPDLLVSGIVVDADGKPLGGVVLWAMTAHDGPRHNCQDATPATSDAEGRFRIEGTSTAATVNVGASLDGCYVADAATFPLAAADARLVMQRAGGIAGSVNAAPGQAPYGIRVLIKGEPQHNGDATYRNSSDEGLELLVDSQGRFATQTLRPGDARVEIRTGFGRESTVVTVDDVKVVAGETTRDPRLQQVDLAKLVRGLAVTVADDHGKPVPDAQVYSRPSGSDDGWKPAEATKADGIARVQADAVDLRLGGIDVLVACRGCRTAMLHRVKDDVTVALRAGPPCVVTLRLAEGTRLPEPPLHLAASLLWTEKDEGRTGFFRRSDPRDLAELTGKAFDTNRVATFETSDAGTYRVKLTLRRSENSSFGWTDTATDPAELVVVTGENGAPVEIVVSPDAKGLEEAAKRMTHDR